VIGLIVLRLIHLVVGAFWVGSLVFIAAFLIPAVRATGPAGGAVMRHLTQVLHLHRYMVTSTWLTLLSGAALAWRDAGTLGFRWFAEGSGRFYGAGAVLAIIATVIGFTVNAPTAQRLGEVAAAGQSEGRPPSPEELAQIQYLQARLGRAARLVASLLVLAAAAMAVARYAV
jgi:hypothetical protein